MNTLTREDNVNESAATSVVAGGMVAKLLPAGIGAVLIAIVDPPQNKKEMFLRVLVAFVSSYLFSHIALDFAHQFSLFSFLDWSKDEHRVAVESLVGASGWFVLGAAAMLLKRFRADPIAAVQDVKKVVP